MAPLLDLRLNRFGVGPAAMSHRSRGVDKYDMDRREQITQMLKDRIARFKRENAHIWEKPSRLFKEQPKEPEKRELPPAEKIKRDLGF